MKPPMVPNQGRAVDTINFRNVKESGSIDGNGKGGGGGSSTASAFRVGPGKGPLDRELRGVPLDSGLATPGGELADPFEEFNSVTLHHDGDGDIVEGER